LSSLLPYALVLLCPLMMIFMMRGMTHEQGTSDPHAHHTSAPRAVDAPQDAAPAPNTLKATAPLSQERCH
jgi:hypothetical protein